jgi:hypothetical protein
MVVAQGFRRANGSDREIRSGIVAGPGGGGSATAWARATVRTMRAVRAVGAVSWGFWYRARRVVTWCRRWRRSLGMLARPLPLRVADVLGVGNAREMAGVCGCVVEFRWSERVRWPAGKRRDQTGKSSGPWPGTYRPCRGCACYRNRWDSWWLSSRCSIPQRPGAGS